MAGQGSHQKVVVKGWLGKAKSVSRCGKGARQKQNLLSHVNIFILLLKKVYNVL